MRWLIIGVLVVLLAGCSTLRLSYSQGPTLAYWWIDRYIDVQPEQAPRVRAALDEWFRWHRSTQLDDLARLLVSARQQIAQPATPAQVCRWSGELTDRLVVAYERVVPAIAEITPTLAPRQLEHLEQRYASNNGDFADDYQQASPQARHRAAVRRAVKRAEDLYGRLNSNQRALIARSVAASPFDAEQSLAERQARQQEILAMLRRHRAGGVSQEAIRAELLQFAERIRRSPRESHRGYQQRLLDYNCAFMAEVHNSTTVEQRTTAAARLDGWLADLRALGANVSSS